VMQVKCFALKALQLPPQHNAMPMTEMPDSTDDLVLAQCKTATVTTLSAETPITGGATKSISAASLVNGLYGRRRSLRATFGL